MVFLGFMVEGWSHVAPAPPSGERASVPFTIGLQANPFSADETLQYREKIQGAEEGDGFAHCHFLRWIKAFPNPNL